MSSPSPEFTVRRDLPQTMRDGTVLRAEVPVKGRMMYSHMSAG